MEKMRSLHLHEAVNAYAGKGLPLLGICLGAQLLTEHSEEGDVEGLGLIAGHTKLFKPESEQYKVPHMGWNEVVPFAEHKLFAGFPGTPRYYFVHSYYMAPADQQHTLCTTQYDHKFASGIHKGNIAGVQFHPEKSHLYGLRFIKNFLEWNP
jgi:glutamine amidotransferase